MDCIVDACKLEHHAKGYCVNHYARFRKHGDIKLRRKPNGSGTISESGYRLIYFKGKQIYEHRLKMQFKIGRELKDSEIVHHINGNKLDNRIENLVITTRPDHAKQHYVEEPWRKDQFMSIQHLARISPHKGRGGYGQPQKPRPEPSEEGLRWNHHKKRQGYIVIKCRHCLKLFWTRTDIAKKGRGLCRPCGGKYGNHMRHKIPFKFHFW